MAVVLSTLSKGRRMFVVGDVILLKGITGHGRNRIREHGEMWKVLSLEDVGIISIYDAKCHETPIKSLKTGEWRWLQKHDRDFVISQ